MHGSCSSFLHWLVFHKHGWLPWVRIWAGHCRLVCSRLYYKSCETRIEVELSPFTLSLRVWPIFQLWSFRNLINPSSFVWLVCRCRCGTCGSVRSRGTRNTIGRNRISLWFKCVVRDFEVVLNVHSGRWDFNEWWMTRLDWHLRLTTSLYRLRTRCRSLCCRYCCVATQFLYDSCCSVCKIGRYR